MTKEDKARIARENGAKSKGPVTQAGKDRSRANGLKHGQRAATLRHLAQPHPAILCNEDSRNFFQLFHNLIAVYSPIGPVALDIVREIAIARTDITRNQLIKAANWNRELIKERHKGHNLPPELVPVECSINTALALAKADAQFDRAIDRLFNRIAKLERRLRFVEMNFPSPGTEIATCEAEQKEYDQTDGESDQTSSNQQVTEFEETPLVTADPSETTREAYDYFFPGRKLLVVEPEPT